MDKPMEYFVSYIMQAHGGTWSWTVLALEKPIRSIEDLRAVEEALSQHRNCTVAIVNWRRLEDQ